MGFWTLLKGGLSVEIRVRTYSPTDMLVSSWWVVSAMVTDSRMQGGLGKERCGLRISETQELLRQLRKTSGPR